MKRNCLLPVILVLSTISFSKAQDLYAGVNSGIGVNLLDVEKSEGGALSDWNKFSWIGNVEGLVLFPSGYILGAELNIQRLYSYSRFYSPGNYYINGNVWTFHAGAIAGIALTDQLFIKTGANLRIYSDGSGVAPGFMASVDYAIPLMENFSLPIGLRTDLIFANATTFSLNAMIGVRYYIDY